MTPLIALDVQHLFRLWPHLGDRGAEFAVEGGHAYEADLALGYASACANALVAQGFRVLTNADASAGHDKLHGWYSRRQHWARELRCNAYLALHVNAGGGRYGLVRFRPGGGAQLAATLSAWLGRLPELTHVTASPLAAGERGLVCLPKPPLGPLAALIEPFFGDQPRHHDLMAAAGLRRVGEALADGIVHWWAVASRIGLRPT